ncbi:MAG TPA: hypothetical protein VM163_08785 [bacterium]|nr:hypothetical protein [bacterium]
MASNASGVRVLAVRASAGSPGVRTDPEIVTLAGRLRVLIELKAGNKCEMANTIPCPNSLAGVEIIF